MTPQMPRSPIMDYTFEGDDGGPFQLGRMTSEIAIVIFLRYVG